MCRRARWPNWRWRSIEATLIASSASAAAVRSTPSRRPFIRCSSAGGGGHSTDEGPVHIAIPTTLSAGEFTAVAGITDERTRVKRAVSDPRLVPRTVYTDPTVTLETPPWLWAASGVRALDHAVETIYASRHHPLSDAAAARGLSMLVKHLPASLSTTGAEQLEHRLQCQLGAWLSVFGVTNAGLGLSHALGHQIGPRWDVPHGVTSCITLPHAMRYMAARAPERFGPIAQAFGVSFDVANAKDARSRVRRPHDSFHRAVPASSEASRCAACRARRFAKSPVSSTTSSTARRQAIIRPVPSSLPRC